MRAETRDCSQLERDILEWNIPEEVLAVLLKDRTTGHNLIWATDDYAERGDGFAANDEMRVKQIVDVCHQASQHSQGDEECEKMALTGFTQDRR